MLDFNIEMFGEKTSVKNDIEEESKKELTEIEKKFRENDKKQRENMKNYSDSNFWTCLVFQTKEQAQEFNEALNIDPNETFIDGLEIAKKFGIKINAKTPPMPKFGKNKSYSQLT